MSSQSPTSWQRSAEQCAQTRPGPSLSFLLLSLRKRDVVFPSAQPSRRKATARAGGGKEGLQVGRWNFSNCLCQQLSALEQEEKINRSRRGRKNKSFTSASCFLKSQHKAATLLRNGFQRALFVSWMPACTDLPCLLTGARTGAEGTRS